MVHLKAQMPSVLPLLQIIVEDFANKESASQRLIVLRMPCSVKRACGLDNSAARRRRFWVTLVSVAERLCSCSLAKQAEYPSTHKYSFPCTSIFSAAARTPGWAS